MIARQRNSARWSTCGLVLLVAAAGLAWSGISSAQDTAPAPRRPVSRALLEGAPPDPDALVISPKVAGVLEQSYPRSADDLRVIETQLRRVLKRVIPATVGIQIGPAAGSGVIISPDGLVLTAGHVSGEPGRNAVLVMPDGRRVRAKTLGLNRRIDSGLIQIADKGPWPFVEMARSNDVEPGQWVVATGHPGGFSSDRSPPVRLGRVLYANDEVICTDCTLVGGDSGGPLFNMKAEVIGIHSRIGRSITSNFHVPIATYHDTWDRLAAGENWGGRLPSDERGQVRPFLGIYLYGLGEGVLVKQVSPGTPAARAGIQENDVITKFDGVAVSSREEFIKELWSTRPGQRIEVELQRGDKTLQLRIVVGGIGRSLPGSPDYEPSERRRRSRRDRGQRGDRDQSPQQTGPEQDDRQPEDRTPPNQQEGSADGSAEPEEEPERRETTPPDTTDPKRGTEKDSNEKEGAAPPRDTDVSDRLKAWGIELDPVAVRSIVARVLSGSAAERAGLRAGDVILKINGRAADNTEKIAEALAGTKAADVMEVGIRRNGRELSLSLRD